MVNISLAMSEQRIIFPWETDKWSFIKNTISTKVTSINSIDTMMFSLSKGRVRSQKINVLFNSYFTGACAAEPAESKITKDIVIGKIFPRLQKLVLNAPETFKGFHPAALTVGRETNLTMNRLQVATLVACMWFGLFEYRYLANGPQSINSFPEPNFFNIFNNHNSDLQVNLLRFILGYFLRVDEYLSADDDVKNLFCAGNIVIRRNVLKSPPDWNSSEEPITTVWIGEGLVEDAPVKMHAAFAHEKIGGQAFSSTVTPDCVVLLVRPECLPAMIFCQSMEPDETITVIGAERMSKYSGYGSSVKFTGDVIDDVQLGYNADETEVMAQIGVVFMDASRGTSMLEQCIDNYERDLNKAFCGFDSLKFSTPNVKIASGNWTYGFNGANVQLKFLEQLLAASKAKKCLVYYPFSSDFEEQLVPFADWLNRQQLTVSQLHTKYLMVLAEASKDTRLKLMDFNIFEELMRYRD